MQRPTNISSTIIALSWNRRLVIGVGCVLIFQQFLLPLWLLPLNLHWAWLVLPCIVTTPLLWGLIHEGIHGLLHPEKSVNETESRLLAIGWGVSFDVLRYGHLLHHRLNRNLESEYYNPAVQSPWRAKLHYYATLCGGLYAMEVFLALCFAFSPNRLGRYIIQAKAQDEMQQVSAIRYFSNPERQRRMRMDMAAVLLVQGLSFISYGKYWLLWVALLAGKALISSLLDNIYHYGTPADNSVPAKEVDAPAWLSLMLLHMNYHRTHHSNAKLPWHALPHASLTPGENFWHALKRQFSGPLVYRTTNVS